MRLQKFLATSGVDSRRNCESYIRDGRVTVDGTIVKDPACKVDGDAQNVRLDGERLRLPSFKYYLLNKPKGVLCTNRDPRGRPRAIDLVPARDKRLFTVGRLDENTMGLLLVTNDGDLAEHLAHPRYEVQRKYRVQVAGIPKPETIAELKKGMHFSEGFFRFAGVRVLKRKGRSTFLELELREGKNREIRRLLARVGHKVIGLERIAFGPLKIGRLSVGNCRELRGPEVRDLIRFASELSPMRKRRTVTPSPSEKQAADREPAARKPSGRKPAAGTGSRRKAASGKKQGSTETGRPKRRTPTTKRTAAKKKPKRR